MTAAELGERITGLELLEWAAFERVEGPIGNLRGDVQAGVIASLLANVNRKKGAKQFKIDDFIPEWDTPEAEELTPEQQRERVFAALGGKAAPKPEAKRLLDAKGKELPTPEERKALTPGSDR